MDEWGHAHSMDGRENGYRWLNGGNTQHILWRMAYEILLNLTALVALNSSERDNYKAMAASDCSSYL